MKESKIIIFDDDDGENAINYKIKKLEQDGWEVVEHKVAMCMGTVMLHSCITVLLQRERDNV